MPLQVHRDGGRSRRWWATKQVDIQMDLAVVSNGERSTAFILRLLPRPVNIMGVFSAISGGLLAWKCPSLGAALSIQTRMDSSAVSYAGSDTRFIHLHNLRGLPNRKYRESSWEWWLAKRSEARCLSSRFQELRGLSTSITLRIRTPPNSSALDGNPGESWDIRSLPISESAVPCSSMHTHARMERHMYPKWGFRGPEPRVDLHPGMPKYELFTTGSLSMQTVASIA
jgi:hypothetical protein